MKNSILLFSIVLLTAFNAVDEKKETGLLQQDMFTGTWKYQNGNEVFIVNLWADADGFKGHYRKIIVDSAGNQVSVVYKSNKKIGNSNYTWPFAIYAGSDIQGNIIGGNVSDNTVSLSYGKQYIMGKFTLQILNPGCYPNCSLQAQWTVKKMPGLYDPDEPDFNIPTNLVLTKQ